MGVELAAGWALVLVPCERLLIIMHMLQLAYAALAAGFLCILIGVAVRLSEAAIAALVVGRHIRILHPCMAAHQLAAYGTLAISIRIVGMAAIFIAEGTLASGCFRIVGMGGADNAAGGALTAATLLILPCAIAGGILMVAAYAALAFVSGEIPAAVVVHARVVAGEGAGNEGIGLCFNNILAFAV